MLVRANTRADKLCYYKRRSPDIHAGPKHTVQGQRQTRMPCRLKSISLLIAASLAVQTASAGQTDAITKTSITSGTATETSAPTQATTTRELTGSVGGDLLHGQVSKTQSPFLSGSVETVPKGSRIDLTLMGNLNSEVMQKGDEIYARVAADLKNGEHVLLPSGWYIHGLVTDIKGQRRLGRDGYLDVEFDKLVSPDGQYELPFNAKFSTADNQLKAVAKVVAIDTAYTAKGALVGSILSVQLTGLPVAISTHGISVGVGAGVGAGLGLIGALKRKGNIACLYPGDQTHLTISEPLTLPGFNPDALRPAPQEHLKDLQMQVLSSRFSKDPFGDSHSRLLTVEVKMNNQTKREISFFDLAVVSDHDQRYYPFVMRGQTATSKKVEPQSVQKGSITFSVDSPKYKYWLVLLDRYKCHELARVPVN